MPQRVVSLAAWRDKETAKLVAYLNKRLEEGDLGGLIVQSINQTRQGARPPHRRLSHRPGESGRSRVEVVRSHDRRHWRV
jgi:hypothetical protein